VDTNYDSAVERREFVRLDYATPLACKVCKRETIDKLLHGYTSNISQSGLLCNVREQVSQEDVLWISFDRSVLEICRELERRAFIYQNGIIAKVARVEPVNDGSYDLGVRFVTREEWSNTLVLPQEPFLSGNIGNAE
jgi:hypothetical protein